ncbi:MAG: hypothetical protein H6708_11625 [Kofleriaceae bacterium]|nr:hypothetical protein [Kofleriaceae bacterium]
MMAALVAMASMVACAKTVPQDAHSGKDAKYKGAKSVILETTGTGPAGEITAEGSDKGIVTYPGGDRVDWKLVELPADKTGKLHIELRWVAPRPGLDLSFDVYNEWGRKVDSAKPKRQKRDKGKKKLDLEPVKGKYYIEVYASNRGDAGKYKLSVRFDETPVEVVEVFDPSKLDVAEPPKLAAVPPPCDPNAIDKNNPECKGVNPPCDPNAPDKTNPNCTGVFPPCGNPPDPNNPNCLAMFPDCDPMAIDPKNPKCKDVRPPPPKPTDGMIVNVQVEGNTTTIVIDKGKKDGIDRGWTGNVLDSAGRPLTNGSFTVLTVRERVCSAKVKLTRDSVAGKKVQLLPP